MSMLTSETGQKVPARANTSQRSHRVKRSGHSLGSARGPPTDSNEHRMMMFHDILLLDDAFSLRESHDRRHRLLESLL